MNGPKYQVESLLRPPVELWSAAVAAIAAAVLILAPWAVFVPRDVGAVLAGLVLLFLVIPRCHQAFSVMRYQRNLKRLPVYRLKAGDIPVSTFKLFLGKGFRWTQKHTQRIRDTMQPAARPYIADGALRQWARKVEVEWEGQPVLGLAAAFLRARAWWNPLSPPPPVGGNPAIHAVETREEQVYMDLRERVGHMLVLGTTRVGKTRLAEVLIAQDIQRGDVVIVIDPKGDPDLLRRVYIEAKRAGREDELYIFHLGFPAISARYNAIGSFSRITEVATRIANQLPNEGNAAAFREFAWRFVNIVARALVALSRRPDYRQILRHINDIEPLFCEYAELCLRKENIEGWPDQVALIERNIHERSLPFALKGRGHKSIALYEYIRRHNIYDPVLDGLVGAFKYDRTYYDKIVSSVGPLLEKLTTGQVAELLSPDYYDNDDPRPIFDWRKIIRMKGIVYVGLDALSDVTVSAAVGNSMFSDLVSVAGEIYKHGVDYGLPKNRSEEAQTPISIHADEFNELIGDEFIPLLNKSGGAGMQVTAYTQTWSDIEARTASRAKSRQITGNFNTLVMLRVRELETAMLMTEQLPVVEVSSFMSVSGVNDSSDFDSGTHFTSRNEDRIMTQQLPMIAPTELTQLPKGQAFALLEGGVLWKLRLPMPDAGGDKGLPQHLLDIAAEMRLKYPSSDQWHKREEEWWKTAPAYAEAPQTAAPAEETKERAGLS